MRLPWRRLIRILMLLVLIPVLLLAAHAALIVVRFDPEAEGIASTFFDRHGQEIATVGTRRRDFTPLHEIAPIMQQAIVAIEDRRFFLHPGVDMRGVGRALWVDIQKGSRAQGASTITQQLARVLYLSPEKTIQRKLSEIMIAFLLEMRYSKSRILEMYLNTIYFGEGAYGISEAALIYFGKPAAEIELEEAALLAALPKAPSALSPYSNPEPALARRNLVLERMSELTYISPQEAQDAQAKPLHLAGLRGGLAPYFVDYVTAQLIQKYGTNTVHRGGLRVHTTLDLKMQRAAGQALGEAQGAIVALDVFDGAIRSMVGGRDYIESQFNRATQALRQPGSAFKPFVYAAALEQGLTMNHLLVDHPVDFAGYKPENFKGEYWGSVTLKFALTRSLNTASVRLLKQIGVDAGIEMAQRLGISTLLLPDDRNLALVLGGLTKGVTPLEMTAAYAVFANQGFYNQPYAVKEIYDNQGKLILHHQPRPQRVLSEEVAYFMTNMLQDVVEQGTGTAAKINRPQAGKTGTTNNTLSAWYVGYTPQLAATVYIGHDTRQPLSLGGGALAAPMWRQFTSAALSDAPKLDFQIPIGVQAGIPIDPFTGKLAGASCGLQEQDAFRVGSVPTQVAPCYWNANAQPQQPYRMSDTSTPAPVASQLPGGIFGDDELSLRAGLALIDPRSLMSVKQPRATRPQPTQLRLNNEEQIDEEEEEESQPQQAEAEDTKDHSLER